MLKDGVEITVTGMFVDWRY